MVSKTIFTEDQVEATAPFDYVSPSQLKTARDCKTKWFLSRRTPRATSESTALGTEVHNCNELFLLDESYDIDAFSPKALLIAKSMRPLLPLPGHPREHLEASIDWAPDGWPVGVRGFVDIVEPPGTVRDNGRVVKEPVITDEKTCAEWRYMPSPDDLSEDPQGILYGAWSLLAPDGPFCGGEQDYDTVLFRHVTAITRGSQVGKEPRTVSYRFSKSELQEKLAKLLAEEVLPLTELAGYSWPEDVDKIPYDNRSCWKFGRCEFWDICKAHGRTPVSTKPRDQQETLGADLLALFG